MSDERTELTVDEIVSAVVKESPYDVTPYDVMKRMIEGQRETIDELTSECDRLREQINAIVATAESYESSAQDPQLETSVAQERIGFAQDIYQALGIADERPKPPPSAPR